MKLPNWFRILWWVVLVVILTTVMWLRHTDLLTGKATGFDALTFVVWVCLLLVPIFSDISILGLNFKQEFDELKNHLNMQVSSLRSEIHNAVDFRPQVNPQFNFPLPPPDTQLPSLEGRIRPIIEETLKALGVQRQGQVVTDTGVPLDANFLFSVRYSIEKELRELWKDSFATEPDRISATKLLPALVESGRLTDNLAQAIRQVHSVCSPAVHAQQVSEAKVRFVRDLAPDLLATLRAIRLDNAAAETFAPPEAKAKEQTGRMMK